MKLLTAGFRNARIKEEPEVDDEYDISARIGNLQRTSSTALNPEEGMMAAEGCAYCAYQSAAFSVAINRPDQPCTLPYLQ
jgi:hypothetical protein